MSGTHRIIQMNVKDAGMGGQLIRLQKGNIHPSHCTGDLVAKITELLPSIGTSTVDANQLPNLMN